ncbi:MAG: hypothetical protein EKK61_03420 [Rickettsiales bacterium]|nr:MAG: hypothetical protein EKK61_03420 [Rickettsiales bacterium]
MKKLFLSLVTLIALIFITFYISIATIDFDKIYQEFISNARVDISKIKKSHITITKFPMPVMHIDQIMQPGKVELTDVAISFSPISIITFSPKISSVKVNSASIYLNNDDIGFVKHDEFISELITKNILSAKATVKELKFIESDNDVPIIINNFSFNGVRGNAQFDGNLSSIGTVRGFFKKTDNITSFWLEAMDKNYSFNLNEDYKDGVLVSGKINIKSNKLFNKLTKFIPELNRIANYLNSDNEVSIDCDILPAKDNIVLDKIIISSNSILGSGITRISKNTPSLTEMKFIFSKIDFSNRLNQEEDFYSNDGNLFSGNNFDLSKNNIIADIHIDELKYNKVNSIKDINFKIKSENNAINIEEFSGKMDQDSSFNVSGNITQNSFRSIFNGAINLKHKDLNDLVDFFSANELKTEKAMPFEMVSNIKFSSVDLSLQNIHLKTDDNILTGNISTKFIGKYPRTSANLKFTNIDVDKKNFPAFSYSFNFVQSLLEGMKKEEYLNKFIPIRKINSINNISLNFDQINFNNKLYHNMNFDIILTPGRMSIEHLYINDGKNWIDGSFTVEAQGIKPLLSCTMYDGSIDVDFLSASGLLNLRQKILDNIDLDKITVSMEGNLKNLYHNDVLFEQVNFAFQNDKNLIAVSKFDANIFNGKLNSSGSILLSPYTLNFVYALNSANVEDIAKLLPAGIINKDGKISTSGTFSTNGEKIEEQLYNLYVRANIIMQGVTLGSFSIDEFIEKIRDHKYDVTLFNDDLNKMLLTGATQVTDLKTELELVKGVATLQPVIFKTKYATSSGTAKINLYDFGVDVSSSFSFFVSKMKPNTAILDYIPANLSLKVKGDYFGLQKEAEWQNLVELLKTRNLK